MDRVNDVKGPFGDGTNPTDVREYTVGTTHEANVIPKAWSGEFVKITLIGSATFVRWMWSTSAAAEVDRTVAATAGGAADSAAASTKRGGYLANGVPDQVLVPVRPQGGDIFLIREGDNTGTLVVEKRSGPPGRNDSPD